METTENYYDNILAVAADPDLDNELLPAPLTPDTVIVETLLILCLILMIVMI